VLKNFDSKIACMFIFGFEHAAHFGFSRNCENADLTFCRESIGYSLFIDAVSSSKCKRRKIRGIGRRLVNVNLQICSTNQL
jgi:hypothetical protein